MAGSPAPGSPAPPAVAAAAPLAAASTRPAEVRAGIGRECWRPGPVRKAAQTAPATVVGLQWASALAVRAPALQGREPARRPCAHAAAPHRWRAPMRDAGPPDTDAH